MTTDNRGRRRPVHRAACPVIVVLRGTERAIDALAGTGQVTEPERA